MNTSTQVNIYNMALAAIGVDKFVSSLVETSLQARVLNVFWPATRDQVLSDFPWGFAMRYVDLQLSTKTVPGWAYCYVYPNDCLQARRVLPYSEPVTDALPSGYIENPINPVYAALGEQGSPFSVVENETAGGLCIATNMPNAVLEYTGRVTTTILWSPAFVNALVLLLASKVVSPLAANPKYGQVAGQAYEAAILKAGANDLNEGRAKAQEESELIKARY